MSPNSDSHDSKKNADGGGNLKIVDLEFGTLRQFREVMAPRLAYEGFFVATNEPLAKGTPVRFRFLLPDGFVLVEGTAVVAWSRGETAEPGEKPGMAMLFNELEHQSREIIDELIDFHIATGGDQFEIGPLGSDAGDSGTDALTVDPLETKVPLPEAEPAPAASAPDGKTSEEVLPDWLSKVAQKHDVDLSSDARVPIAEIPEEVRIPQAPEQAQQEFEISLMPEDVGPDPTPAYDQVESIADVTVPPPERMKAPRDFRLRLLLPIVALLVVASGVVWWIANRGVVDARPEPAVVVEDINPSEPSSEVVEEPESSEIPVEIVDEQGSEAVEAPVEDDQPVVQAAPQVVDRSGPATELVLVGGSRRGDATVVTIRANGQISERSVHVSLLKDPARVWVRIQHIETFYRPNDIEVLTPEVERLRVGHHPEETPQSIYVVFDLEDPATVVRQHTVEGDTLRVVVGRP